MNEITKIHLGRQAFTIAVDAYKALQDYLQAIKRHMGGSDEVLEEIELRMVELLAERGVSGDKVVLAKDVAYLKEQLGKPGDFSDEAEDKHIDDNEPNGPRRLFRDPGHGMLAGVCAGLGNYFGIDALWIRLLFIVFTFAGASSILVYIILWLVVPEAKTGSERLQMQGKPVTVDAIKGVVERADVKGAATRAQHVVGGVVHNVLKVVLIVIGTALMIAGVGTLLGLTTLSVYWALNHDLVPAHIFPVGASEVLLLCLVLVALAVVALFLLIAGLSLIKRKWRLPGWGLGAMIAIFLASLAVSGALVADAAPKIHQRYEASQHTYTLELPEFHKLQATGSFDSSITYEEATDYSVTIKYWGDVDFSKLKAQVQDGLLTIDSNALAESLRCEKFCLFHSPILRVVVRGPQLTEATADMQGSQLVISNVHDQTIKVHAKGGSIYFPDITADVVHAERLADGNWNMTFNGMYRGMLRPQQVTIFERTATIGGKNIDLKFAGQCGVMLELNTSDPILVNGPFQTLTINGKLIGAAKDLRKVYDEPGMSDAKCVDIEKPTFDAQKMNDFVIDPQSVIDN